ncbi:MAG: peptidoglycan-binding protein [Desulfuromonadales bacterium]|nr:peptidoglycan-binding protein [Desulfuromonadales bacterium]
MAVYKIGSTGEEVRRVQEKLRSLGIYRGPLDGVFGGGTGAAVKLFQSREGLDSDGLVGPATWQSLFKEEIASPAITYKTLDYRCLALTGSFETGTEVPDCFAGLSGDFDGQGISFGVLQWNFGQGSLQPLLKRFCSDYPEMARAVFHDSLEQLQTVLSDGKSDQMAFARSIQDLKRKTINEPWRGMFKALGRTDEFQRIQLDAANTLCKAARQLCSDYGLWSERAVALMFDIKTQNGSIGNIVQGRILDDYMKLPGTLSDEMREEARLRIIANRRAEAAKAAWIEDVRTRKLCIANGGGTVHGIPYDLEGQFGIGLRRYPA